MAEPITHAFVSAKSDSADTTLVSASEWNDGHIFSGGINGQILVYDNTQPNNMRWTDGSAAYNTDNVIISNGLTSPQPNFATINFTSNSSVLINVAVHIIPFTTGAVDTLYNVNLDGAGIIGSTSVHNGDSSTQYRTEIKPAGAHSIDLDMSTVGNVTWTNGLVEMAVTVFGV